MTTISGAIGSVRWGYHLASTARAWVVAQDDEGLRLTATLDAPDAYWLSQQPLVFEVTHAKGVWKWPVISLQITGVALIARLGPRGK